MGGASSGQRVSIHNHTSFLLRRDGVREVCGESRHCPNEIPPQKNEKPEGLVYLENYGTSGTGYGSEIIYGFYFVDTPDDNKGIWSLEIFSIGAYNPRNSCFAAKIVWMPIVPGSSFAESFILTLVGGETKAQVSWRDTSAHHACNPKPEEDGNKQDCPFTLDILEEPRAVENYPDICEVKLILGMKPLEINNLVEEKFVKIGVEREDRIMQTIPPGKINITYERTTDHSKCVKVRKDSKWGRAYKYSSNFNWGLNFGAEGTAKVGNDKGTEKGGKVGVSLGCSYCTETTETSEHMSSSETQDTVTVKKCYKWTWTTPVNDTQSPQNALIEIKKHTYRQNVKCGNVIVCYKEMYQYEHVIIDIFK